jgi:HK97 family phage major capsid protein
MSKFRGRSPIQDNERIHQLEGIAIDRWRQAGHFDPKTRSRYDIIDAIRSQGTGMYKEISQELAKHYGIQPVGFLVPDFAFARLNPLGRRDLYAGTGPTASTGTAGQGWVPLEVQNSMVEYLYNFTVCKQAGATVLDDLRGNLSIPRELTANTASWAAEAATIARTAPSFDQIEISPSRIGCVTAYSKQLLAQSSLDIQDIVLGDILKVIAVGIDQACLFGLGPASNQPTGICTLSSNTTGYNYNLLAPSVTFGGTATLGKIEQFCANVEDANVALDDTASFIVTPLTKSKLKTIPAAVNYPRYLWEGKHDVGLGLANGYITKAMNTLVPNQVLFGKFSSLVIGSWSGLDLVVDPYTLADFGQIRVVVHAPVGTGLRQALSFAVSTDAGNQ